MKPKFCKVLYHVASLYCPTYFLLSFLSQLKTLQNSKYVIDFHVSFPLLTLLFWQEIPWSTQIPSFFFPVFLFLAFLPSFLPSSFFLIFANLRGRQREQCWNWKGTLLVLAKEVGSKSDLCYFWTKAEKRLQVILFPLLILLCWLRRAQVSNGTAVNWWDLL